jgi:hypothetical protein
MVATGLPYVVDNSAFNVARFNANCYLSLLRKVAACPVRPLFVTVPDQVGNHKCTSYLFDRWLKRLVRERLLDLPLAFVLQDGCRYSEDVPWDFIEAVFIGGTDDFKEDVRVTCDIIPEAKARGKFVHLGRCNSRSRLRLALRSGCDSVDGSSLSMFPRTWIPKFVRWCKELEQEVKDDDVLLCDLKWRLLGGRRVDRARRRIVPNATGTTLSQSTRSRRRSHGAYPGFLNSGFRSRGPHRAAQGHHFRGRWGVISPLEVRHRCARGGCSWHAR